MRVLAADEQALGDQAVERVQARRAVIVSAASTVAPPANTAKRAKHSLLGVAEQVVAPVDRRAQRLLARGRVAGDRRPARRARCRGARRSRPATAVRSGRPPARSPAAARRRAGRSPRPRRRWRRRGRSRGRGLARARRTARRRRRRASACGSSRRPGLGQRERRHRVALLGVQRERLATGGQDRERGTGLEQPAEERRGGAGLLEVVGRPAAGAWRPGSVRPPGRRTRRRAR